MSNSAINAAIRAACGRSSAPAREPEPERPIADLGVGRGSTAAMRPPTPTSVDINARLRAARQLQRSFLVPGGIRIDDGLTIDDLLAGR